MKRLRLQNQKKLLQKEIAFLKDIIAKKDPSFQQDLEKITPNSQKKRKRGRVHDNL